MTDEEKLREAIIKVYAELENMPKDEFRALMDKYVVKAGTPAVYDPDPATCVHAWWTKKSCCGPSSKMCMKCGTFLMDNS